MKKIIESYNSCIWEDKTCNNSNQEVKKNFSHKNFYLDFVKNDLGISDKKLRHYKMKNCEKCGLNFLNPWFNKETVLNIYSSVYGQHHKGWHLFYKFLRKGDLYFNNLILKKIINAANIKNYAEFNCPFGGIMFNFIDIKKGQSLKNLFDKLVKLNLSRQLAGFDKVNFKKSNSNSMLLGKSFNKEKRKKIKSSEIQKYLITDSSSGTWNINCNSRSMNCKAAAQKLFDLKILNLNEIKNRSVKFDMFGFFNSLDHALNPKEVFDFAIKNSNYVIIGGHGGEYVAYQHRFSMTKSFMNFLRSKKIYVLDLTSYFEKQNSDDIYFICSAKKNKIEYIKKKIS